MVRKKRQTDAKNEPSDSSDENVQSSISVTAGCQHVKKSVDTIKLRKLLKVTGLLLECSQCMKKTAAPTTNNEDKENVCEETNFEYDSTLWLCLQCGTQLCGRSRNQHALQHYKTPHSDSHSLTMNTRTFEIWCYQCDNEVRANSRKSLLDCVEMVKKMAQKPPVDNSIKTKAGNLDTGFAVNNVEDKMVSSWDSLRPLVSKEFNFVPTNRNIPPAPPLPPTVPGVAKRVQEGSVYQFNMNSNFDSIATDFLGNLEPLPSTSQQSKIVSEGELLPRVRGLTNLGNTCFFNAVIQCLAQTPYLLEVLKELEEPGEEFVLPGGVFKFKNDENVELPMIRGTLSSWGSLTAALANALEELQSGGGVFTPSKLFEKLCSKCPQFRGGNQHDSHELLRHLLESVRSEDLKRYQRVILHNLGYKDQDIGSVTEEMRQKCKIYGNQAADRILRPEQVFRGFLVSTLTCQDCLSVSSRHEYFLDMSLPVSVEKPQPPQRHRTSPDNTLSTSIFLNAVSPGPTKAQVKKEKERERKEKRAAKHRNTKAAQKLLIGDGIEPRNDPLTNANIAVRVDRHNLSSTCSEGEQSDADVEDNLIDDNMTASKEMPIPSPNSTIDSNGNNELLSPGKSEKRDDSPENMNKDSIEDDENDSGIATSPAHVSGSFTSNNTTTTAANAKLSDALSNVLTVGISGSGAGWVRDTLSESGDKPEDEENNDKSTIDNIIEPPNEGVLATQIKELQLGKENDVSAKSKRKRTQSYSDWSTTIAPRYQCEDSECSVQSCLNNFTAVELMTGNNKVGCENCTKALNNNDPKAKTVNTNATKQFLISSPPAVLILHLKRFQLGSRCVFRKLTRTVTFPMILDIAPFCGSKVKNLPNIDRKQKKLLYSLYGIVEHSGGMYGGHYTAFVKVRPKLSLDDKRWAFLPKGSKAELDQDDEQRKKLEELLAKEKARDLRMKASEDSDDLSNSCNSTSVSTPTSDLSDKEEGANGAVGGIDEAREVEMPLGKWYYVSDSHVQEVYEEEVLKAQAYLLFYERIY